MLADVLSCLRAARGLDSILVVTRDPELIELARRLGAEACIEPLNRGHTEAVRFALATLIERRASAMLTVPGDVPSVSPPEIEAMISASQRPPSVVFAPSRSGLGTNGVLLRPPDAMPLRFGEPSFPNHLGSAQSLGLTTRVLELPGLGLDVDTPEDLALLLADAGARPGPRTREVLADPTIRGGFEVQTHDAR